MRILNGSSTESTTGTGVSISRRIPGPILVVSGALLIALPMLAFGSVEGSLAAVHDKLVGTLLPLAAICGLVMAAFSFVMGHPNARQHLIFAMIGAAVGFGADSIVALIRSLIQ